LPPSGPHPVLAAAWARPGRPPCAGAANPGLWDGLHYWQRLQPSFPASDCSLDYLTRCLTSTLTSTHGCREGRAGFAARKSAVALDAGAARPPGRVDGHIILPVDPNSELFATTVLEEEDHLVIGLSQTVRTQPARKAEPPLFERGPLDGVVPGLDL